VSKIEELQAEVRKHLIHQSSMDYQFKALRGLYDAASMVPHAHLMEQYRQQLHDLLDVQLDTQNTIMELSRRMIAEGFK
jgi:hypothetical protein